MSRTELGYHRPRIARKNEVPGPVVVWTYLSFFLLPVVLVFGGLLASLGYGFVHWLVD